MAKGKNLNPADAYRKSLRKKELKKNKTERAKAREFSLVKKDTTELEEEIQKLEASTESTSSERTRLASLKEELENINKKKSQYVEEHPEHRKLVYRHRRQHSEQKVEEVPPQTRNFFRKNGLPRHPERSIYYDPVMNPFGVPPPGMPYMERPLRPDELIAEEEEDDDDDNDDDIAMPEGPPPGAQDNDDDRDSDDDIPMPEGPPPGSSVNEKPPPPVFYPTRTPLPPNISPPHDPSNLVPAALPNDSLSANVPPRLPLPPLWFAPIGPPPPGPPPNFVLPPSAPQQHAVPALPAHLPPPPPGLPPHPIPPPPPGFSPSRQRTTASIQDPLSSASHQTFQAHRDAQIQNRTLSTTSASHAILAAATLSAEPQLRDLKKEATAFVPTSVMRKKLRVNTPTVNAAPSLGPGGESAESEAVGLSRPDLLSTLKEHFGSVPVQDGSKVGSKKAKKDDYEKFVEEMGDILVPAP